MVNKGGLQAPVDDLEKGCSGELVAYKDKDFMDWFTHSDLPVNHIQHFYTGWKAAIIRLMR